MTREGVTEEADLSPCVVEVENPGIGEPACSSGENPFALRTELVQVSVLLSELYAVAAKSIVEKWIELVFLISLMTAHGPLQIFELRREATGEALDLSRLETAPVGDGGKALFELGESSQEPIVRLEK